MPNFKLVTTKWETMRNAPNGQDAILTDKMKDELYKKRMDIVQLLKRKDSLIESFVGCSGPDSAWSILEQIYDVHQEIVKLRDS